MIDRDAIRRLLLPSGPLLSLALIGLMLLSGLLYYRAIRVQRFLEPALALTQPRIEFDKRVVELLDAELNPDDYGDVRYSLNSILVREQALTTDTKAPRVMKALGKVFIGILGDSELRGQISVVLVSTKAELTGDMGYNKITRSKRQDNAEEILSALYAAAPLLEQFVELCLHGRLSHGSTSVFFLSGNASASACDQAGCHWNVCAMAVPVTV